MGCNNLKSLCQSEQRSIKLKEICSKIGSGATPRGGEKSYKEDGIPLIRSLNIYDLDFEYKNLALIDEFQARELENVIVEPGDILINITGASVGRCTIPPKELLPARVNQHVSIIRIKSEIADPYFVLYYLVNPNTKNKLLGFASAGATREALTKSMLEDLDIDLPSIYTQKGIALVLKAFDDRIKANRKINRMLEEIARAIFKHWFIDFEFPNENSEPYKSSGGEMIDSSLGPIPKGWKVSYIGDLLQIKRKSVSPEEVPTEFPYIGLEHMPKGSICLDIWGQVGTVKSEKMRFNKGDILFGKLRPYFHKVGIAPVDGVCSTDILVLNVEDSNYWSLAVESVARKEFIDYASAVSTGTRMPRANWEDLKRFKVSIPCGSHSLVLERFDNIFRNYVSAFFEGIYESKVLSMMRDNLLPKLMSGEIRVPVSEKEVDQF
ncbi:MAG TPA: restriction endonuclease subunit S [Mesotoga infera]|uniref:Restriction endonuclease subunit S n=1 Tax=Mesotoga infera TaxID=1236046 RepID=A0A7C1H8Z4_9BACT|nr:restriction endonuclease subunit S [Mesotoga infera]